MECPRCKNKEYCKDGFAKARQRYQCKSCHFCYTVERSSTEKSEQVKELALDMYLEGVGFRAIGRIVQVSYERVYYWIKDFGEEQVSALKSNSGGVIEMDAIQTYLQSKKLHLGMDSSR